MYPGARIAVYCKSDSMEPDILKGDMCIIRFEKEPINDKIMLVGTGEGFCLKKIKKVGNRIELHSTNPKYKPIIPKELKIIGRVIGICKKLE